MPCMDLGLTGKVALVTGSSRGLGMRERRSGVIVMIASIYGREMGGSASYQTVKSAQISLGKALAKELAPDNVRVVTVAPGSILFPGGSWERRQKADPEAMAR